MLTGLGTIHWSGGCEYREILDLELTPTLGGAVTCIVRDNVSTHSPVEVQIPTGVLTAFVAELRALLGAPSVAGDLSTSDDEVAVDLPLATGRLRFAQQLADEGPPLDPIIAAIHRLAEALEASHGSPT
jgi:hypothetical protein